MIYETWADRPDHTLEGILLDLAREPIIGVDAQGSIRAINAAASTLLGFQPRELVGVPIAFVVPTFEAVAARLSDGDRARGGNVQARVSLRREDGSTGLADVTLVPVPHEPGVVALLLRDVSRPAPVEAALRASESRYRDILDGMMEGFQLIGRDWRYLFVNDVVCRHGQRTREELLGWTMMQAYPGIEQTPLFPLLRQCMDDRTPQRLENAFHYPDGSTRWFDLSIQPAPEGIFILSTDVTERRNAELRLSRQLAKLAALRNIDLAILSSDDARAALDVVVAEAVRTLDVEAARVLLLSEDRSVLEVAAQRGLSGSRLPASVAAGAGLGGRAIAARRAVCVSELGVAQDCVVPGAELFAGAAAAPLVAHDAVLGVIEVYSRERLDRDADWLAFLDALAGQATIAIARATAVSDFRQTHAELQVAYDATIEGWSRAMDLRDRETVGHTLRVTAMTLRVARAAGMSEDELLHVRRGALLHDIGKLGVPDHVLLKEGPLTEEEWVLMRKHTEYAHEMLFPISYLRPALDIPYCHHERWDGSGYPRGLLGHEIPRAARLFAVVDVWDALRTSRPYRPAWSDDEVIDYLKRLSGTQFDPEAVTLLLQVLDEGVPDFHPVIGTAW